MITQILRSLSGIIVVIFGVLMLMEYPQPQTPPFYSGIVFIILGLNLWLSHCSLLYGLKKCKGTKCSSHASKK